MMREEEEYKGFMINGFWDLYRERGKVKRGQDFSKFTKKCPNSINIQKNIESRKPSN